MPKYSPKISLIIRSTKNPVFFSVSALFTAYLLGLQSLHFPTIIPQIQTFIKCRKNTPKKTGISLCHRTNHFILLRTLSFIVLVLSKHRLTHYNYSFLRFGGRAFSQLFLFFSQLLPVLHSSSFLAISHPFSFEKMILTRCL